MSATYRDDLNQAGGYTFLLDLGMTSEQADSLIEAQTNIGDQLKPASDLIVDAISSIANPKITQEDIGNIVTSISSSGAPGDIWDFTGGLMQAAVDSSNSYKKLRQANDQNETGISNDDLKDYISQTRKITDNSNAAFSIWETAINNGVVSGQNLETLVNASAYEYSNKYNADPTEVTNQLIKELQRLPKNQWGSFLNDRLLVNKNEYENRVDDEGPLGLFGRAMSTASDALGYVGWSLFGEGNSNTKNSAPINSISQQSEAGMSPFGRSASRLNTGLQGQFNGLGSQGLTSFGGQSGILSSFQGASQGFGSMTQSGGLMGGMFSKGASALGSLTDANDDPFAGMKDSLQDLSGMFTNTFVDGLIEGKMNFKDLADSVIKDIGRMLLKKGMMKMLGSFGGGAGGAAGSGLLGAIGGMFGFADGGIFADGNVTPASDVKRFTNTVATSPTTAPMALFGEAGPEAIMPLSRGADGKLGVKASGGGNSSSIVYSPVIQVDSRADRAQVMADVNKVVQASSAQLIDRIKRNPRMIEA